MRQILHRMGGRGAWYYWVTIVTAGLFAWAPFLHAATRLSDRRLRRRAALYGVAAVVLVALSSATPTDANGDPRGAVGNALSTVFALLAIAMVVVACVQLRPVRRAVYGLAEPSRFVIPPGTDPAVAQALAARERRNTARALLERDPMLARDLNIGRPDRPRSYDDGGLIDLNTAPAGLLVAACGLTTQEAERLVSARELFTAGFSSVDEALVYAELSGPVTHVLRDRGVLLPR
ncbi:type II secretion system protein GspK [Kribbella sp. NPDC050241]|uniref:type II secretion system protein GspK n=1 Tax=Kribbella sp. NPDC050241 TaxID=3364115 RepID=UPI0037B638C5